MRPLWRGAPPRVYSDVAGCCVGAHHRNCKVWPKSAIEHWWCVALPYMPLVAWQGALTYLVALNT